MAKQIFMSDAELLNAELLLRTGQITHEDFVWVTGLEDDQTDKPPPRGFKSWKHFDAFKWHQEQRRLGRPKAKRRRRAA